MLKMVAELKTVVDKWVGNLHLDPNIPHEIAMQMCDQFKEWLKSDKEAKVKAQQEELVKNPPVEEVKNG